jgi:hypothetical protein
MQWHDDDGLRRLPHDEAVHRLESPRLGYLGFTVDALPAVVPVPCAHLDGRMVVRMSPKGVLARSAPGSVVSLLVCDVTPDLHGGWSITITGLAEVLNAPGALAACEKLLPGAPDDLFLGVTMDFVTGREYSHTGGSRVAS